MATTTVLAVVFGLSCAALLVLRQFGLQRQVRRLSVIEASRLPGQGAIAVVRAGERYFLVGSTASAIANLGELDASDWRCEDLPPARPWSLSRTASTGDV